uniref:Integrase core domain containing protein n=1 Tax=Solanum tuberosum TaxID=4113 RepID=M1DS00_SOLTU
MEDFLKNKNVVVGDVVDDHHQQHHQVPQEDNSSDKETNLNDTPPRAEISPSRRRQWGIPWTKGEHSSPNALGDSPTILLNRPLSAPLTLNCTVTFGGLILARRMLSTIRLKAFLSSTCHIFLRFLSSSFRGARSSSPKRFGDSPTGSASLSATIFLCFCLKCFSLFLMFYKYGKDKHRHATPKRAWGIRMNEKEANPSKRGRTEPPTRGNDKDKRLASESRRIELCARARHDPSRVPTTATPSAVDTVPAPAPSMAPVPLVVPLPRLVNRLKEDGLRTILEEKLLSIEGLEGRYSDVRDTLHFHRFEYFTRPRGPYIRLWVWEFYTTYDDLVPKRKKKAATLDRLSWLWSGATDGVDTLETSEILSATTGDLHKDDTSVDELEAKTDEE